MLAWKIGSALGFGFLWGGVFLLVAYWSRPRLARVARAYGLDRRRARRRRERIGVALAWGGMALAAGLFGKLGLLAVAALVIPSLAWLAWRRWAAEHFREMESSGLVYLHALHGLLRGGLSLPTALFQLVEADTSSFARSLRRQLAQFHRGEQLGNCLEHFRLRSGLKDSASLWTVLELAYRRGLPLVPLLDRRLPGLDADADLAEKLRDLWRTMAGQAALIAGLPWGLLAVLGVFQPEVLFGFLHSAAAPPAIGLALFLEGTGLFLLWRACRYP